MGKFNILHISDLHIGNFVYDKVEDLAISIVEAIEDHDKHVNCIVVTGDIFDGKSEESEKKIKDAVTFFKQLCIELNKKSANNIGLSDFILVPGNHDQIRTEEGDTLDNFKTFLKTFYSKDYFESNYNSDHLYTIKIFETEKVAIVGLNSCMIEKQALIDDKTKWLKNIEFENSNDRQKIIDALKEQKKWDDYGFISKSQLRVAFDELNNQLKDPNEYSIITCFHHHFYPFPEIYDEYGDSSLIRNFTNVIDKLQKSNVKVVLHGHKHLPIIRPVINQKYFSDPNSMLYVFSAGSIGKKDVTNRSFQIIDIYPQNSNRIAEVHRFNYKHEELQDTEDFLIPPRRKYEQHDYIMLREVFSEEFSEEYQNYIDKIHDFDHVSQGYRIDEIIKNISKTITSFDYVKKDIQKSSKYILILLLSIHYRINALNSKRNSGEKDSKEILEKIKSLLHEIVGSNEYEKKIYNLLNANNNSEFERYYDEIEKDASKQERKLTAYCTIATFFTDLYLTLSKYGEFYYKKEKLNVNIKLLDNTFHTNIPVTTIKISSDVDRRSAYIQFKCKDATVHKIAVLIIKDFEKRINKIDDSFKILDLKIYYLSPKVDKVNYDLENFNFEAYIPTLLPLLTGDNLYKQKEVFIRELLQNSLDAILLREKVDKTNKIDKTIRILFGESKNPKTGKLRKYLQIVDNGIGMDTFKIERYFTSIGRSFYVSDEFEELQKSEEIEYKPISNFGIGFLSAFMICKEIHVSTKSYDKSDGLEIDIPNFDGCFFIKKSDNDKIGTAITLYEDERELLDEKKIINYIKTIMLDFQLDIEIHNEISNTKEVLESHGIKRKCNLPLFLPFTEKGIEKISWKDEVQNNKFIEKYDHGLLIDFPQEPYITSGDKAFLNSGIRLSYMPKEFFEYRLCKQYYNFPSSYLELDVARERIVHCKNNYFKEKEALELLAAQANDLIDYIKENKAKLPISTLENIYRFFIYNELGKEKLSALKEKLFYLSISVNSDRDVSITLEHSSDNSLTWVNFDPNAIIQFLLKCIKLFFNELGRRHKEFTSKFKESPHKLEEYSNRLEDFSNRLEDFSNKLEDSSHIYGEFPRRFEDEFSRIYEELSHRFEEFPHRFKEFPHRFEEFAHRFEEFPYIFEEFPSRFEEFSHKFKKESYHIFEKESYHIFKELSHIFEESTLIFEESHNIFEKDFTHIFEEFSHRFENPYQGLLLNLVVSSFLINRINRRTFSFLDLYLRLYYFYFIISNSISIEQADKFELKF